MKPWRHILALVILFGVLNTAPVCAEKNDYNFQKGPLNINLDNGQSTLNLPAGYSYLNREETKKAYKEGKEPCSDNTIGMVFNDETGTFAIIEFEETGYIKDNDADRLDADQLLEDYRRGTEAVNEERRAQGVSELEVVGWDSPPRYDKTQHILQWAIRGREKGKGDYILNHNAVLLGRSGKLSCVVIGSDQETAQLDAMRSVLSANIRYTKGHDYLAFKQGDKVSDLTLAGLITGGAATAAYAVGKGGLLAKLGAILLGLKKLLIIIVLAIAAFFKKIWNAIFGKKDDKVIADNIEAAPVIEEDTETQDI